jgi:hypothetical protein
MSAPTHIMVTAAPGRRPPIHKDDGRDPSGGLLYADDATVIRVKYSQAIRRSITRGDLIPCNMDGVSCAVALAAAKDELAEPRLAKKGTPK